MYFFITIIFIAELIIAGALIFFIVKADNAVLNLNNQVQSFKPLLYKTLGELKGIVANFVSGVQNSCKFVKKKRRQYLSKVVMAMVTYAVLFFFKGRFKKAAVLFQSLVFLKDMWDEYCTL